MAGHGERPKKKGPKFFRPCGAGKRCFFSGPAGQIRYFFYPALRDKKYFPGPAEQKIIFFGLRGTFVAEQKYLLFFGPAGHYDTLWFSLQGHKVTRHKHFGSAGQKKLLDPAGQQIGLFIRRPHPSLENTIGGILVVQHHRRSAE
ncbi:MAG: hypothetical protein GY841_06785 [FCB group bacterium]|nr:hypothetical protein [FCB group bacterium]